MNIEFSPEEIQKIEEIKSHYPEQKAAIIAGYVDGSKKIRMDIRRSKTIHSRVTQPFLCTCSRSRQFLHDVLQKPMGKYHIQVCTNVSCMLLGGEEIYMHLCNKFGIKNMEVTEDGRFSIEEVECMGACGGAPMIAINEEYYENIDIKKVDEIINSLK